MKPLIALPEIHIPNILDPKNLELMTQHFQEQYFQQILQTHGEETVENLFKINDLLDRVFSLTPQERLKFFLSQSARQEMIDIVRKLKDTLKDDLGFCETEGKMLLISAKVADDLFHDNQFETIKKTINEKDLSIFLSHSVGPTTLDEISKYYKFAIAKFAKNCLIYTKARQENNQTFFHFGIMFDQWFNTYLSALYRCFVFKMKLKLKILNPTPSPLRNEEFILEHLLEYPQMRDVITSEDLNMIYKDVINTFFHKEMNELESGINVFNNLALLATVIGDYDYAKKSLTIAKSFCKKEIPSQLQDFSKTLDLLTASIHA